MSKKNLLNESQIRKFMKYADITPLADKFINETYNEVMDEEMEEGYKMEEGDHDKKPPMEEADDMMEMADMMEADDEMEVDADADADEDMVRDLVVAIAAAIKDKTGVDVAVEDEAEMAADDAMRDEDDAMRDEDDEEDAAKDMAIAAMADEAEMDMDEMVSRIAENVMARVRTVNERKAKAAKVDQIAESIVARVLKGN